MFDRIEIPKNIAILMVVLVIAIIASVLAFTPVRKADLELITYTRNAGELTKEAFVGQTFQSSRNNLSGISVMFATYSGRKNNGPITFHLRRSVNDQTDLRTATISPDKLGDNQLYRFDFDPIKDSAKQNYFFFVESPTGLPGSAVTVDIDTRDPYHLGSAYLVRNQDGSTVSAETWNKSGKSTVDVVFGMYHSVPFGRASFEWLRDMVTETIATWPEKQGVYATWSLMALVAVVVVLAATLVSKTTEEFWDTKKIYIVFAILVAVAIFWRMWYARSMPLTNDEGNYLYDARTLIDGGLAGGDGYVKAPLVILWLAFWQLIAGSTVWAGRLASVVAGALTTLPIYVIGSRMAGKRAGILAAVAWALFGAPVVDTVYVHTQPLSLLFGISGIAVVWWALTRNGEAAHRWRPFIIAGILFGLGVISRKSILALGLVPLALVILKNNNWKNIIKQLLVIGIPFLLTIALMLGAAGQTYGEEGIIEAIGFNSAEDGQTAVDPAEREQVREYSIRGMTPFFRESLPLIVLAMIGWGYLLESLTRKSITGLFVQKPKYRLLILVDYILPKLVWIIPGYLFWWAWSFFKEYEGGIFHAIGGMEYIWMAMVGLIIATALWPHSTEEKHDWDKNEESDKKLPDNSARQFGGVLPSNPTKDAICAALVGPLWLGGLVFFYINWIKFHANYIVEFLPALAVLSGVGLMVLWQRFNVTIRQEQRSIRFAYWGMQAAAAIMVFWTVYLTGYITYTYEHTGTFQLGSIKEAVAWAKGNIPTDQPIFTGAAVVPYESGHHVSLDIAHPRWYAYQFTREDSERLNTFLPPVEAMVQAFRDAQWVMYEQQTGFSFLMEYSEIEKGLNEKFEKVYEVENGSNPITFYRRIQN